MRKLGLEPDPWQTEVLESDHWRLLLNCCRQAGKSTVVALLGLVEALFVPGTRVLLLSRSHRQSTELFRIVLDFHLRLGSPLLVRRTAHELHLSTFSRIVCLPCKEETVRGYSRINLLIIDEAARVPDDLYRAVRPMLAVSGGRLICLSTPYGKRGFFHDAWARGGDDWARIEVPAERVARIPPEFLDAERRALGESWFRQEYCCSFEAMEGLVYPDFARCVAASAPVGLRGRAVGGIDFGFRNPFAAVWGTLDHDGVLWLTGEHYSRGKPLSHHAGKLPRQVEWYCVPARASERCELRCAGFVVRQGDNAVRPGIAAVTARLGSGTLRVVAGGCPNLLAEAQLYHYGEEDSGKGESPLNEHNHALDALRYLVLSLDARHLARPRRRQAEDALPDSSDASAPAARRPVPRSEQYSGVGLALEWPDCGLGFRHGETAWNCRSIRTS
jgi:hypothetical protein